MIEMSQEKIEYFKHSISVLLVTATDTEAAESINNLKPLPNESAIIQMFSGSQTYYIGTLGIYGVVLVQSEMGSIGRNSSLLTTLRAIEIWEPKAIIMVGVAFGIDSKKQQIGDVIVSSHIIPYENSRIGKEIVFRSELPPSSTILLNRIRQIRDWKFPVSHNQFAKLYVGPILSGEKLIDNISFRNDLIRAFPNAIGGEMESVGVYGAANEKKIDWLIIKSICDFADGEKGKFKKEFQSIAIKSAISFTERVLNIRSGFGELGFKPLKESSSTDPTITYKDRLKDLMALFDAIATQPKEKDGNIFKVAARQIVQTEVESKYDSNVSRLQMLIPKNVLESFEMRIERCWTMYNKVLVADREYLPDDIDDSSYALQKCICRELQRLLFVNGDIPDGLMQQYWDKYKCETNNPT
ncbi:MAG: hypothetical protein KBB37_04535 [Bacteroidia bacterium]|nr:hypothetical protein [Bacteroidia bacterium]MBP9179524.1 hypothetical protein [Bacteroidia bacterium]MBP9724002.1 hypothetical protein [Bacteroidia bacterium]